MGNDPGRPLTSGQTANIKIRVSGPLDKKHAQAFKASLQAVVKKYRPLTKGLSIRVKKKKSG